MARTRFFYWNNPWPGHVALAIDADRMNQGPLVPTYVGQLAGIDLHEPLGRDGLSNYVSWTSSGQGGNQFISFHAHARTFWEDKLECGGDPPKSTEIHGLDIQAMREVWAETRLKEGAHWKLLDKNCAIVVMRILRAGGCDQHVPSRGKRKPLMWTPQAAYEYSKSAARHTAL